MARTGSKKADPRANPRLDWETPRYIVDRLAEHIGLIDGFDLDVCARADNAKAPTWFTPKDNGLILEWSGNVWCNPPYGPDLQHWFRKAYAEARTTRDSEWMVRGCMLVPANITDRKAFHKFVVGTVDEIVLFEGRIAFEVSGVPFGGSDISNMALIYRAGKGRGVFSSMSARR